MAGFQQNRPKFTQPAPRSAQWMAIVRPTGHFGFESGTILLKRALLHVKNVNFRSETVNSHFGEEAHIRTVAITSCRPSEASGESFCCYLTSRLGPAEPAWLSDLFSFGQNEE